MEAANSSETLAHIYQGRPSRQNLGARFLRGNLDKSHVLLKYNFFIIPLISLPPTMRGYFQLGMSLLSLLNFLKRCSWPALCACMLPEYYYYVDKRCKLYQWCVQVACILKAKSWHPHYIPIHIALSYTRKL
jgi:hypothetical protein